MGPHLAQYVAWAKAYLHTKWHLDPCSRLATIDMGLIGEVELGPHLTNVAWIEAYRHTK